MCRNLQVSHLSLGREGLRAKSGFTVYMNQNSKPCVQSWRIGFFSLFPLALQSFASFPLNWVLLYVLNI